jgi:hypothetical protein
MSRNDMSLVGMSRNDMNLVGMSSLLPVTFGRRVFMETNEVLRHTIMCRRPAKPSELVPLDVAVRTPRHFVSSTTIKIIPNIWRSPLHAFTIVGDELRRAMSCSGKYRAL